LIGTEVALNRKAPSNYIVPARVAHNPLPVSIFIDFNNGNAFDKKRMKNKRGRHDIQ
jgi:hypothetical protein